MRLSLNTFKKEDSILGVIHEDPFKSVLSSSNESDSRLSEDSKSSDNSETNSTVQEKRLYFNPNDQRRSEAPNKPFKKNKSADIKEHQRFQSFQLKSSQKNLKEVKKKLKISRLKSCSNQMIKKLMTPVQTEPKKGETDEEKIHHKRRSTIQMTNFKNLIKNFSKQNTKITGTKDLTEKWEDSRVSQTLSKSREITLFEKVDPSLKKLLKIYRKEIQMLRRKNNILEKEQNEISNKLQKVVELLQKLN